MLNKYQICSLADEEGFSNLFEEVKCKKIQLRGM
jgi:hypothetical protein